MQLLLLLCTCVTKGSNTYLSYASNRIVVRVDTPPSPKGPLPYPFEDQSNGVPMYNPDGGLMLSTPPNIKTDVQYNPVTGKYDIYQKMGSLDYRPPTEMDSDQYEDYMFNQAEKSYFKQKTEATTLTKQQQKGLIPPIHIGGKAFEMIFGSNTVNIRPQGSAELTFGFENSKIENPALPVIQRSLTTFKFDENIQLNVVGEIGDKLKLSTNYNTKATFDFQNQMKLGYTGHEDDIIKNINAGNVSFPLPGTLITGSQSLFGVETKLQFGRLSATLVYAQEKGDKKTLTVQNGSQTTNFNIKMDQYQANQHYFLSQFFVQQYDAALAHLPIVNTSCAITKIEVWVTNTSTQTQNTRDIIAYADLGESRANLTNPLKVFMNAGYGSGPYPPSDTINSLNPSQQVRNNANILVPTSAIGVLQGEGFQQVTDFEKIDLARMLSPSEYTLNPKLGYISLRQPLNYDQVLAVAYQYTYNGKTYQVGQFSTDGVATTNELMVKMLKSTNVSPKVPLWQLMMKNIYALGSYQVNSQNFILNIWYSNPATGVDIPYLPTGSLNGDQLLRVLGLDQLDQQGDREPDGLFDFLNGVTIDAANGSVIFPTIEPFGKDLDTRLLAAGYTPIQANAYVFQALYDSVLVVAQQQPNLDRFWLRGSFQSSASSDISLNAMNIPPGSVLVTAGGIKLTENVDYTVDYTLGRVKILNQGLLSSGTPIQISLENNALFSIQSKTYA
ncbi:MAG TPA: cell surface protein SprA, partial [Bacteroidia bacterium]|nr:cell surface protein SprA [Bacteroidia bacterium]